MEYADDITKTVVSGLVLIAVYFICLRIYQAKYTKPIQILKYEKRTAYILVFIFIFVVAKIWLHGFIHFFTILGLIGAALIITHKELLNNVSGCFIIVWRGLFIEGDYININEFKGYVNSIGLLYFTLREDRTISVDTKTYLKNHAKLTKIPNSYIINNPIINYTANSILCKNEVTAYVKPESDLEVTKEIISEIIEENLSNFYSYNSKYFRDLANIYRGLKNAYPFKKFNLRLSPSYDKPIGIKVTIEIYCYHEDFNEIKCSIEEDILIKFKEIIETKIAI